MPLRQILTVVSVVCVLVFPATAETVTLATYNIEHFESSFEHYRLTRDKALKETTDPILKALLEEEERQNQEDQWEVSRVITHPRFNPDILVIQEGCSQSNLEYFNKRWLSKAYETVIVFPSNTDRAQHLGMMLKPGFKVIARKDKYREEKDPVGNDRGGLLFARGPAFALVQTPTGYKFWVGTTHQKSKSGNNVEVTAWRNREAVRTHAIMKEIAAEGPDDVILLGDMNDEVGVDEFEKDPASGGDAMANLIGPAEDGFVLATEPLVKAKEQSFGGYWTTRFRALIDHAVATPSMKDQVESVEVFRGGLAAAASDHYPVMVKIRSDAAAPGAAAPAPVEKPAAQP